MDVLLADGLHHDGVDVIPCGGGRLHLVEQVQTVIFVQMIKDEGVRVFIPDIVHEGNTPQFGPWALPPFEDCICQYCDLGGCGIVEIDLFVIIDCFVAAFDHFDSTEEGVVDEGWDDVDTARRVPADCGATCAEGWNALEVAAVSLTAKGMDPMKMPC
jgi:hypothetical protein